MYLSSVCMKIKQNNKKKFRSNRNRFFLLRCHREEGRRCLFKIPTASEISRNTVLKIAPLSPIQHIRCYMGYRETSKLARIVDITKCVDLSIESY